MSIVAANRTTLAIQRNYDEVRAASYTARSSLDKFMHAFERPAPNCSGFRVKVFLSHRRVAEHIWLENLELDGDLLTGTAVAESRVVRRDADQRRSFTRDRITDWMYVEDGRTIGAYTERVTARQQKEQRRASLKRMLSLGLKD